MDCFSLKRGHLSTQSHTLHISSPWNPPATRKFSLTAMVLICTLESDWDNNPGCLCDQKDSKLVQNHKTLGTLSYKNQGSILIKEVTDYQGGNDRFSNIEHFFAPPQQWGPMHDRIVLHQVYIMLWCCP